jgi:hypothetical protein
LIARRKSIALLTIPVAASLAASAAVAALVWAPADAQMTGLQACSAIAYVRAADGSQGVNIRPAPNVTQPPIGGIRPGDTEVPADGSAGVWYHLCQGGWVNSLYASVRLAGTTAPSATAGPGPTGVTLIPLAGVTPVPSPTIMGTAQAFRTMTAQAQANATPAPVLVRVYVNGAYVGTWSLPVHADMRRCRRAPYSIDTMVPICEHLCRPHSRFTRTGCLRCGPSGLFAYPKSMPQSYPIGRRMPFGGQSQILARLLSVAPQQCQITMAHEP